jgi:hypothetical protein
LLYLHINGRLCKTPRSYEIFDQATYFQPAIQYQRTSTDQFMAEIGQEPKNEPVKMNPKNDNGFCKAFL